MANRIQLDLIANDLMSPIISSLQGKFGGFGRFAGGVLAAAFTPDPVTKFTTLALAGLNAITEAAGTFSRAMKEASAFEMSSLNSAVGIQAAANIPLRQAQALTKEMEKQAAIAAKALPGENSDYVKTGQTIGDTLAKAYDLNTKQGLEAYKKAWGELTTGIGFVASTSKSSGADAVNRAFEGFLSGSKTYNELKLYEDVAVSPLFKILGNILDAKGIKPEDVKKLTVKERTDLLLQAKSKSLTSETIDAYTDTVEGINAVIKGYFFDIQGGVFGVMRSVAGQGDRSAFDAWKELLKNSVKLGIQVGEIAAGMGVTLDPMAVLIEGIDWINDRVVELTNFFKVASISGFDVSSIDFLGSIQAIFYGIFYLFHKTTSNIDWMTAGRNIGFLIMKAGGAIARYVAHPETWLKFGRMLVDAVLAIGGFLVGFTIGAIGGSIGNLVDLFDDWVGLLEDFFRNPGEALRGIFDGAVGIITNAGQGIADAFTKIIDWLSKIPGLGFLKDEARASPTTTPTITAPSTDSLLPKSTTTPSTVPGLPQAIAPGVIPGLPLATPSMSGGSTTMASNISVNIEPQPNASPEAIAQQVMSAISGKYQDYRSSTLTA